MHHTSSQFAPASHFRLRLCNQQSAYSMPPPQFGRACERICPHFPPTAERGRYNNDDVSRHFRHLHQPPHLHGHIHNRDSRLRLRRRRVYCVAINPSSEVERNLIHILPFLPIPIFHTLFTCHSLPALSILLRHITCLRINIRSVVTADPKHEESTATKIHWQEYPSIPFLLSLSPLYPFLCPLQPWPPHPIRPVNISAAVLRHFCPYFIRPVPVTVFL